MTAASPRILSIIPPMTQLNTPYPATAYLTGFLRSRGFHAEQTDLALALVLELLSPAGLPKIKAAAEAIPGKKRSNTIKTFLNEFDRYQASIGPAIALLQGLDGSIAHRICTRAFLPEGSRFAALDVYVDEDGGDPLAWAFGALGVTARAGNFASRLPSMPSSGNYNLAGDQRCFRYNAVTAVVTVRNAILSEM